MKKFSFTLQKLMDYKEQILESERLILGDMNRILQQLNRELEAMRRDWDDHNRQLNQESAQGILPADLVVQKNYLNALDQAIKQKITQIGLQREAIDRQTDKVREAKMEVSTIEKLKEKKWEEYRYFEGKAEEQFIDEFVNNAGSVAAQ